MKNWWNIQEFAQCIWLCTWYSSFGIWWKCLLHVAMLRKVMQICRKGDLKLKKRNAISSTWGYLSLERLYQDMVCSQTLANCVHLQKCLLLNKQICSHFSLMKYLSKYTSVTVEIWEPLIGLTSVIADQTLRRHMMSYTTRPKILSKRHMKFYNEKKPIHMETDVSSVGSGAGLLQGRKGMNCPYDEVAWKQH